MMNAAVIGTALARAPRRGNNLRYKDANQQNVANKKEQAQILPSITEVISFMDKFTELIQSESNKEVLQAAVLTLCTNMKAYGHQLEAGYKDQLDRVFIHLRNAGRAEKLDKISRLLLLEAVELRAGHWMPQEETAAYYKSKLAELNHEVTIDAGNNNQPGTPCAPRNVDPLASNERATDGSPPPLLLPGETVKFSGKYNAHQQQPAINSIKTVASPAATGGTNKNNFVKDEVVIRNADSGKVSPGAKERLVQITGPGQTNIELARQLIEQTIQRNASPVPLDRTPDVELTGIEATARPEYRTDHSFGLSDEELMKQSEQQNRQSAFFADAALLDDYQHTVTVGQHSIKIIGQNLELVQAAKLILDEHFASLNDDNRHRTVSSSSSVDDGVVMTCPSQQSPREDAATVAADKNKKTVRKYNRESLILLANSPVCSQPPANFQLVMQNVPEVARKVPLPASFATQRLLKPGNGLV